MSGFDGQACGTPACSTSAVPMHNSPGLSKRPGSPRSTHASIASTQPCRTALHTVPRPRPLSVSTDVSTDVLPLQGTRPINPRWFDCSVILLLYLTFRNDTQEPGRQISLNRCTFIQNRRARFTSVARGQQPPPSAAPATAAAAADTTSGGGGRGSGSGGDGEREAIAFSLPVPLSRSATSDATRAAAVAAIDVDRDNGGVGGNLRNSPDVLGSRVGGGRGTQPPPMLPPAAGLSRRPCRPSCRDDGERAYSASSDEHAWSPRAEERVTFSRRHLAYSCGSVR